MEIDADLWRGKQVLITGHTGFKGAWLTLLLSELGADVMGVSLPLQENSKNLYRDANISKRLRREHLLDIRNDVLVQEIVTEWQPDYTFHLAAQAYVRKSVINPLETINTNVIGTLNIVMSALQVTKSKGICVVTTDKVYKNQEDGKSFIESDTLGGQDPYSASKAASELIVEAINLRCNPSKIPITTARAGNVVGGGDYGEDRLIPDLIRSILTQTTMYVRNPNSNRPWQHVLDCLRGYLLIAQSHMTLGNNTPRAVNFGPENSLPVKEVIEIFQEAYKKKIKYVITKSEIEEASNLKINSSLAGKYFDWRNEISSIDSIIKTANWYKQHELGSDAELLMLNEIKEYRGTKW